MAKKSKKSEGIYWAYIIVAAIALNICAAIYTVVKSTDYPLDYDESYFTPYQQVENDFINIQAAEVAFNKRFKVRVVGAQRTRLSITNQPAMLLKDDDHVILQIKGVQADKLNIDARIKQPQSINAAKSIELMRSFDSEQNLLSLQLSSSELQPGRNTLMVDVSLGDLVGHKGELKHSSMSKQLPNAASEQIIPRRFLRLELCKDTCAASFKLPDGVKK